jgi:FKBP-type peptidyl-prolyl cis-trans isomerase
MRTFRSLAALLAVVLVAGCLDGSPYEPNIEKVYFDPSLNVNLAASTKTASGLYYRDLQVGDGTQVLMVNGDSVGVRYTGRLRNAVQFDSNVDATTPLRFRTGSGSMIAGFDEGVRGMRVNGRRQLIIPPDLAYGRTGRDGIPTNSILVFEVTLQFVYASDSTPAPTP